VMFLKKAAEFPVKKSLEVLGLPARTCHRWVLSQGKGEYSGWQNLDKKPWGI